LAIKSLINEKLLKTELILTYNFYLKRKFRLFRERQFPLSAVAFLGENPEEKATAANRGYLKRVLEFLET